MDENITHEVESNPNPTQNPEGTTIPEAVPAMRLKLWEDIEGVEILLPTNIFERTRELAKLLNLRAYEVNYEPHYKIYDLWVLFEVIFRYPLVKSFYYESEVIRYYHTILAMIYALFPNVAINDYPLAENREEEIKIINESYRAYTVHHEMLHVIENINLETREEDYNNYSTDNLRKALESLVYLLEEQEVEIENYDEHNNNLNYVGIAKDLGENKVVKVAENNLSIKTVKAVKNTMRIGGKLLIGANIALSVTTLAAESALADLKNNTVRICKVLFTRGVDPNIYADSHCIKDKEYRDSRRIGHDKVENKVNELGVIKGK